MSNKVDISQIKKYMHGQLDAQTMHRLERQAQDDPFLMDALEGYELTGVKDQQLVDLKSRLQQRLEKKEAKIISMRVIAIAASVSVVLTIGGLWYYNSAPQTANQLTAQVDKTEVIPIPTEQPAVANAIPDSILVDSTLNIAVIKTPGTRTMSRRKRAAESGYTPMFEITPSPPSSNEVASAAPEQKKQADFREMAVMSYSQQKARKADSADNQASTKTAPGVMNEVVEGGRVLMETTGAVRPKNAQPQNGWDNFEQYIKNNSTSPDGLTGTVRVRFTVNGNGTLSDIRVTKILSPKADQKALDAVKNGPKWWGNANGKPKNFTVKFKFRNE